MSEKPESMPALEHEPWNEPMVSLDSVQGQPEALLLAETLESFRASSHRTSDGVPMHLAIAAELRRLHADVVAAHTEIGNQARKVAELHAENEANDRNLCQLTDELAKTVALLRQAWAVIRWQCFGECRTEGVEGLPTPSEIDAAIREHLKETK